MTDLITLAEYKAYKGITNPAKDAILTITISAISDLIKAHCDRSFIDHYTTPLTETVIMSEGQSAIILKEHPIILVSATTYEGEDISADIIIDSTLGVIHYPTLFGAGITTLQVTYRGGYEETPPDIKLAAFELVDYYLDSEHKARKTLNGASIEYHSSASSWPFHIKSILDNYRDV